MTQKRPTKKQLEQSNETLRAALDLTARQQKAVDNSNNELRAELRELRTAYATQNVYCRQFRLAGGRLIKVLEYLDEQAPQLTASYPKVDTEVGRYLRLVRGYEKRKQRELKEWQQKQNLKKAS